MRCKYLKHEDPVVLHADHIREQLLSPEAMQAAFVQCVLGIVKSVQSMRGDEKELASLKPIIDWFGYNISWEELKRLCEIFVFEASRKTGKLKAGLHNL